jgi:hypothetical protein
MRWSTRALALSKPESWGETRIVGGKARFDPGLDARGPMDLAGRHAEASAAPAARGLDTAGAGRMAGRAGGQRTIRHERFFQHVGQR